LWNSFPRVAFTDILDLMRDTGFIGIRLTQFPEILKTYSITAAEMEREVSKRNLHVITISFNAPAEDPARRAEVLASARAAMTFLKGFGASHLVVFSPRRMNPPSEAAFASMCECYNQLGELAGEMGFRAGMHNHIGQMVQDAAEIDKLFALTKPNLFHFTPDVAHLALAGADPVGTLAKYKDRLILLDYKDVKRGGATWLDNICDMGDGEIDFPGCHRVLKSLGYKGWICVDLDKARNGIRTSYDRCGAYVVDKLEPVYV
jgi:sugar phosphate isomerase/epimerase